MKYFELRFMKMNLEIATEGTGRLLSHRQGNQSEVYFSIFYLVNKYYFSSYVKSVILCVLEGM